jgi:hypothetical protein
VPCLVPAPAGTGDTGETQHARRTQRMRRIGDDPAWRTAMDIPVGSTRPST